MLLKIGDHRTMSVNEKQKLKDLTENYRAKGIIKKYFIKFDCHKDYFVYMDLKKNFFYV